MRYHSINNQSPVVDFKTATINGQAPDKGLYFPEFIPSLPESFFKDIENTSNEEIAFQVIKPYVGDCIPSEVLYQIVAPVVKLLRSLLQLHHFLALLQKPAPRKLQLF